MSDTPRRFNQGRLALIILLVTLWSVVILVRLVELQVIRHSEFIQAAVQRQQITRSVMAPRGVIYDSGMDELATSVTVSSVMAEPRRIQNIDSAAKALATILGIDARDLTARMRAPEHRSFMVVKRRIEPRAAARIESLAIEGVYLVDESMRVYPNRQLSSHVLGFVNMNGDGGAGLELQYDKELKGTQGQIAFDVDARRRSFRGTTQKPSVPGHALVLSLDRSLQYITDRELAAGVEANHAAAGIAAVMECDTGRILALSVYPNFNCNSYNEVSSNLWRNRAVSDMYEPGSTFKVVVATAALEAGLTRPSEMIDCQMGSIVIGKHIFHDHKPYGLLTFNQVLENSSNVGAAKLGLRLGSERLYDALRTFGFGSKTGVDLPGEIYGLVRDCSDWSALSIGAISFGQEVGVTSLQILDAINAIANGGFLVRPSVVDRIIDANGDLAFRRTPETKRIMRAETAAAVRDAFEGVVLRGTGTQAALEGYRAAGKTGTAQKIVDGRYSSTKYLASFIGFAPLPQPKITVLVQIDEPTGQIYGGSVSAPVFQRIAQQALLRLKIPPDPTVPVRPGRPEIAANVEDYLPNATPVQPISAPLEPAAAEEESVVVQVSNEGIVLPDFRGLAKRTVLEQCLELGIRLKAMGSGLAVFQSPPAGTTIASGGACSVTFARGNSGGNLKAPGLDASSDNRHALASAQHSAAARP
jgi:cell division protein FtsI (penicillin-binding protein 3)